MARSGEIKVRLTAEEEKLLARLAKAEKVNRSELLRRSLQAYAERERADAALEQLIAWAEVDQARLKGKRPPKVRFRME